MRKEKKAQQIVKTKNPDKQAQIYQAETYNETAINTSEISNATQPKQHRRFWIASMLIVLALALSACSYPGQDLPCEGTNATQHGCTNPALQITDTNGAQAWYVNWTETIVRPNIADGAVNAVKLGVHVFWSLFTGLSSVDFAGCSNGDNAANGGSAGATTVAPAICQSYNAFSTIQVVAVALIPLILVWKIFKSYVVGAFVEQAHESFWSFFTKIFLGAFIIPFLPIIITVTLGMSDLIFSSIIGSAQGINNVASNILGHGNCTSSSGEVLKQSLGMSTVGNFGASAPIALNQLFSSAAHAHLTNLADVTAPSGCAGIQSLSQVQNVGLLLVIALFCLVTSAIFILLGLCFLLRGIILFILFCLSPLAVIAGMTEEFRPWLGRWLEQMQAMLVAPIPVAVCIAMVEAFTQALPSAHDDPANFILQLIYVIAFLLIASLLMFKIAGTAGGLMFGMAVAGLSAAAGLATGGVASAVGGLKGGSAANSAATNNSSSGGFTGAGASSATSIASGSSSINLSTNSTTNAAAGTPPMAGASTAIAANIAPGLGSQLQMQTDMVNALRALNSSNSASMIAAAGGTGMLSGFRFGHTAHQNMQSVGHWLGHEMGISGPHLSFVPSNSHYGGRGGNIGYSSFASNNNNIVIMNSGGGNGNDNSPVGSPTDNESPPPTDPVIGGSQGNFRWPSVPTPPIFIASDGTNSAHLGQTQRINPNNSRQQQAPTTMNTTPIPPTTKMSRAMANTSAPNPVANPFVGDNAPQVPPLASLVAQS